ncbi:hypothetical protein [Parendozoicomonas haliclonae]|uniref:Uncharacterized protein n=1 Tax=Parendozoicomonas haliclonae TaxID=1960125 RepID=A0A1X7ALK3_9GAMM|nr:hypothetical protein [Parendozoicomonas haliclonae]SMA46034.1 hypothetical protein EHSB41UT_02065 [Parendozoicomonas haliclonae]
MSVSQRSRLLPITIAITAACLSLTALPALCDSIAPGPSGYWGSGVLVGQKGDIVTRGLFFPTKEMTFLVGSEPQSGNKGYPPETLNVSTYNQSVYDQLQAVPAEQPVVLRYVHPFPLNPFHLTESKYFVTDVNAVNQTFEQTPSYQQHGYAFDASDAGHHGSYEAGQKSGKFIHVSRWGLVFGKTCTAYLHEGGTKQVTVTKYRDESSYMYNPETGLNERVTERRPYEDTITVPNVSALNIYSEAGCRFAEDLALTMTPVTVKHSRKIIEIWNGHALTIHSMQAKSKH